MNFTITAEQTKSIFPLNIPPSQIVQLDVIVPNMLRSEINSVVSSDEKITVSFE